MTFFQELSIAAFLEKDKKANQNVYLESLKKIPQIKTFSDQEGETSIRQSMFILAERRDELKAFLEKKGITTKLPYKSAIAMDIFSPYISQDFPKTKAYQEKGLILPLFSLMTKDEIDTICASINKFYSE